MSNPQLIMHINNLTIFQFNQSCEYFIDLIFDSLVVTVSVG